MEGKREESKDEDKIEIREQTGRRGKCRTWRTGKEKR